MVVVDASFLMAAFVEESHTEFARSAMVELAETQMMAPGLAAWEFSNILWKKRRRDEISEDHLSEAGRYLEMLEIDTRTALSVADVGRLAALAARHGLTAYDAAYLDLALIVSAPLATTDRTLTRAALAAGLVVHSPFA